jgi:hypothetical protein
MKVTFVEVESKEDAEPVAQICKSVNATPEDAARIRNTIANDSVDGGETFRNFDLGQILCVIYRCTNERSRRNTINHEKRHIEDRTLEWMNVNDVESAAMLAGWLSERIY